MKEKLLTNYGETMKLKADTGSSYCEHSGHSLTTPPLKKNPLWNLEKQQFILCTDGSSGVVMKDKATFAGTLGRPVFTSCDVTV